MLAVEYAEDIGRRFCRRLLLLRRSTLLTHYDELSKTLNAYLQVRYVKRRFTAARQGRSA